MITLGTRSLARTAVYTMAPKPAAGQLMAAPPLSVEGIAAFGWASHQTTRYRGAGAGCTSD